MRKERLRKTYDLRDGHIVVEPLILRDEGYFLPDQQAFLFGIDFVTEDGACP